MLLSLMVYLGPAAMVGLAMIALFAALDLYPLAAFVAGAGSGCVFTVVGYNRDNIRDFRMMMAIIDWEKVDAAINANALDVG